MKESLKAGITYEHKFAVPSSKTVAALYPESPEAFVMSKTLNDPRHLARLPE